MEFNMPDIADRGVWISLATLCFLEIIPGSIISYLSQ